MPHAPQLPSSLPDPGLSINAYIREMRHAGFTLLVDQRGTGLVKALEHLAWRLSEEERVSGKPMPPGRRVYQGSDPPSRQVSQWWFHPAGLLCHARKEGESEDFQVEAIAFEKCGFVSDDEARFFADDGESLRLRRDVVPHLYLSKVWEEIFHLHESGKLLPLARWPRSGRLRLVSFDFLDLPDPQPVLDDILAPSQVTMLANKHALENIQKVLGPWGQAAERMTQEEGGWLREEIALQVGGFFHFELQGVGAEGFLVSAQKAGFSVPLLKERRKTYRKDSIHFAASMAIQERMPSDRAPHPRTRDRLRLWLGILKESRSPRALEKELCKALFSQVQSPGSGFHDLLLSFPGSTESLRKLAWWLDHETPEVLKELSVSPAPDGRTLPMCLMESWLHIPNKRVVSREHRLRVGYARYCLERLAEKVPPSVWVLETKDASPWDCFFRMNIFFPGDTDLIQAHQEAMKDLIAWAEASDLCFPDSLCVPGQGKFRLTDPDLEKVIEKSIWEEKTMDRGPVAARLRGYFGALQSHLLSQELDQKITQTFFGTPRIVKARF